MLKIFLLLVYIHFFVSLLVFRNFQSLALLDGLVPGGPDMGLAGGGGGVLSAVQGKYSDHAGV